MLKNSFGIIGKMSINLDLLPRPELIDVATNINELFTLDDQVARATPSLLPLESPQELVDFLTIEHHTDTYLQRDENGNAIAYVSLIDSDELTTEVLNIGVAPTTQNQGVGKSLMKFAESKAKQLGKKKVKLVTNTKNDKAINFYKKLGYEIAKVIDNYYGDGETRYLLEKRLD
jgi:ribosomal protein S18 acetylase RimI-like enzyme